MRPLHIMSSAGARVSVQGPALRVETTARAPAVMAMRHLSQVICPVATHWSSRALAQCMRAGVPVVFTDEKGRVLGFLHGLGKPRRGSVFDRLKELMAQRTGPRVYATWLRAMESRQRVRLAARLRIPADRHRCRTLKRVMRRERRQRACEELVTMLESTWHRCLAGFVAAFLARNGFNAVRQRSLWPQLDFCSDLAALLEWSLFLDSLEVLNRVQRAKNSGRSAAMIHPWMLARFECLRSALDNQATDVLHRLDMRLLEEGIL